MPGTFKKITSLLALLLVAIPFIFSICYTVLLAINKDRVSEDLQSEQLQIVTVSGSDIKWIIPGKEISIKGNLFDIKSYQYMGQKMEITGLYDEEEDNIQEMIAQFFNQNHHGNAATNLAFVNLLFQPLFSEKSIPFENNCKVIFFKKSYYSFTEDLASANPDIVLPPPRC